ncbi:MAG: hypothetical protein KIT09_20415 [Bryobacteraceae bacterium]|nr:hypothetical protein [Bryobacteraceae bacterium]
MNSDFEELLKLFNDNAVKYLVVGGHAVMLYTEPRYTKDLDLWIEAGEENAGRVFRSLVTFGAPLAGLPPTEQAWFISREDLARNKRACGRHIDLHDLELLE